MKKNALLLVGIIVSLALLGCPLERDQIYPNYTLPMKLDVSTTTNTSAIQVTATNTINSYSRYTIKILNLGADIGQKFVVAGASIGSKTDNLGDNWYVTEAEIKDDGLIGTVKDDGTFEIVFYGKKPDTWGGNNDGAQFKIVKLGGWDNPVLVSSANVNFCVSGSKGYDIVLTIDPNKL
jgi:hypothetical protein